MRTSSPCRLLAVGLTVACADGPPEAVDAPAPWRLADTRWIGAADGAGPEVFGAIAALTVDDSGRMYVFDGRARELRVFGAGETAIEVLESVLRITVWSIPALVAFAILAGPYIPSDPAAWSSTLPPLLQVGVPLAMLLVYGGALLVRGRPCCTPRSGGGRRGGVRSVSPRSSHAPFRSGPSSTTCWSCPTGCVADRRDHWSIHEAPDVWLRLPAGCLAGSDARGHRDRAVRCRPGGARSRTRRTVAATHPRSS